MKLELLHVAPGSFPAHKLSPRLKKILKRNNFIVTMSEQNSTHTNISNPPPEALTIAAKTKERVSVVV